MRAAPNLRVEKPDWPAPARVVALTTLRMGGVSEGVYRSLNLGAHVGDRHAAVAENRNRVRRKLGLPCEPHWLDQSHGTRLIDLSPAKDEVAADGATARTAGQVCAVMTADCLPLFLVDRRATVVGLLHVGWRGLAAGIVEQGVNALAVAASDILAWSGPAIGPEHFEIGADTKRRLGGDSVHYRPSEREGHWYADLYGLVDERLARLGVGFHAWSSACTYRDAARYFSYRRDGETGRMASLIWLKP